MEEFKLYSVSDKYVEWLRKDFPNVYSNKIDARMLEDGSLKMTIPEKPKSKHQKFYS